MAKHGDQSTAVESPTPESPRATRRMPRAQRREQILATATEAFARSGFAATSLEDVAKAAGVTRMIVYTHFESKAALYRAVLERMRGKLKQASGAPECGELSIRAVVQVAAAEPAGFRLLFHHAAREPAFRAEVERMREHAFAVGYQYIGSRISDEVWARWASGLVPTFAIEAIIAWLDAGQPDSPASAAARIRRGIEGIVEAARGE